jgi:hypothetical protein
LIFHDSNKKYWFSKHQNKAEFMDLNDSAVISSDFPGLRTFAASMTSTAISSDFPGLRTFAASMTSTASTPSVASMTSTASFY